MANQLILNPQKFNFGDLISQFPHGKYKKKIFFQSELRSLSNGDATFGVIAYPAWKGKGKWTIGTKITGMDTGIAEIKPFTPPLAFANNEVLMATKISRKTKKSKKKNKEKTYATRRELLEAVKKISKDKKLIGKSSFLFNAKISANPHLEYNVTLDMGGTTLSMQTNPSPPARPQD